MIVDRDARIARIQQKQQHLVVKEERLKDELAEASEANSSQIIAQQTEKTALFHDQQSVLHQLDNLHTHLHRQGESLNEYCLYLQQHGQIRADDTQNVMRLQAQLCKGMHSMSIVDRQTNMIKEQQEKLTKSQKEALATQSEERANLERLILNDLMERDSEVRGVENELKKELDVILKEMNAIREQLEDSDEEDDEDNDDEPKNEEEEEVVEEEMDEEERAAKEEMMKMLQQRREEIERLAKEIEEREELIEELQMRAGDEPPPGDETPRVSVAAKKEIKEEPPKVEEPPKKEEPVDEMAARLQEVMASAAASEAKADDVDEMDLLKLAQSRLTGGGDAGGDDDNDEDESEEEETDTSFDEEYSENADNSETGQAAKAEEEEYDPTEKKEDPATES